MSEIELPNEKNFAAETFSDSRLKYEGKMENTSLATAKIAPSPNAAKSVFVCLPPSSPALIIAAAAAPSA